MISGARLRPRFESNTRSERVAAILGTALGITFTICFITGIYSHLLQNPPAWFTAPARPAGLYRITEGLHVATGIASIPLLFAKLWTVFPKLFVWPPFTGVAHAVERVALLPLVGGSLFLLGTGVANIDLWYPWRFNFRTAHYWVAWITIGALIVHLGAKWTTTRTALSRTPRDKVVERLGDDRSGDAVDVGVVDDGFDRRRFLVTVFGVSGLLTLFTVGQTLRPLERLALLAPRRPDVGPQGFPVNRTAAGAGVVARARDANYRLVVDGRVARRLSLSLAELEALPQHEATLPIACVEGWSASKLWRGIPVRDLLRMAGAPPDAEVTVESLQPRLAYRTSDLDVPQAHDPDTLLALRVEGETLHLDHGYPVRLVGPGRPGVLQTKWVTRLVVR
jgi:DMSO/TMAO reductase YedYZ molybdopterin-dependent catalytic subunit